MRHMSGEQEMDETKKGKGVSDGVAHFIPHCADAWKSVKYVTDARYSCLCPCNV